MRVLAAAFEDPVVARTVLDELRRRYDLLPTDANIAPLGNGGRLPHRTLLAGRFRDSLVAEVRTMVTARGGQLVSDVDEQWTRSASAHESLEADGEGRRH